ncbi:hypothetical protein BLA29_000542 [Euroglyphus maynei]|uniref:Uncharacterized protein n=1 Tax=Euroglyphus maynei TaxID=6958 RepID=A0A1Y3AQ66_EURMA|nr:hypothetical protein BLA29_000542 [Euroglyphus maynei]
MNMEVTLQGEPFADHRQQYGAFKTCTDHISWSNVQNRINFRQATRSPFECDQDDNISSCGSVKSTSSSQVQCQELYPMEVYDNQQFNSSHSNNSSGCVSSSSTSSRESKITQSTRSIYDLIDDEHMK